MGYKQEIFIGSNRELHVYKQAMELLVEAGNTIQAFGFYEGDGLIVVNCTGRLHRNLRQSVNRLLWDGEPPG